ncbi:hypothetical protein Sjap_018034 [Stephania japonica]|uniref:Uncharacterized protein n=1 Tax=Stephania japonica TaxID=461633 RepID=A0AAP0NKN6_9MAGN
MLQSGGQNSIIIVGGANMGANRNARIVLLQREIPDYVNIQVAKGVKEVLVKLGSKGSGLFAEGEEPIRQPIIATKKECLKFAGKKFFRSNSNPLTLKIYEIQIAICLIFKLCLRGGLSLRSSEGGHSKHA